MPDAPLEPALYLVSTPVGNLEDITLRALRVLRSAAVIACEDTRQTRKLLNHFSISTPVVSYHEHNEPQRAEQLLDRLRAGETVAVVSDAGTPGISDPGYRLVRLAAEAGIPVVPVPGASALLAALAAGGLPTDRFEFQGFLSSKEGARRTELEALASSPATLVLYEAPHRIMETLADIVRVMGAGRPVVLARELTKLHEEFLRGTATEVLEALRARPGRVKGEMTLLIGAAAATPSAVSKQVSPAVRMRELTGPGGLDEKSALKVLAKETGLPRSQLYREWQRTKR